jgi:hypothetical protein
MSNKELEEIFIKDLILNIDLFRNEYCGYWLIPIAFGKEWILAFDYEDGRDLPSWEDNKIAKKAVRDNSPLPKNYFLLDHKFGKKVVKCDKKKYGDRFPDDYDGIEADVAVQLAIFGKIVYG